MQSEKRRSIVLVSYNIHYFNWG